jgi:hypothetical protein
MHMLLLVIEPLFLTLHEASLICSFQAPQYDYFNNYLTVRTISKSNIKIVERGTINTTNTQTHDNLIAWLGTGT